MAADSNTVSECSIKICKCCKKVPQSGPVCVVCNSIFHPSCARKSKTIDVIDEKTVNCCLNTITVDDKLTSTPINIEPQMVIKNEIEASKIEIKYLKEIINQKDIIIGNLLDHIKTLKQHLFPIVNRNMLTSCDASNDCKLVSDQLQSSISKTSDTTKLKTTSNEIKMKQSQQSSFGGRLKHKQQYPSSLELPTLKPEVESSSSRTTNSTISTRDVSAQLIEIETRDKLNEIVGLVLDTNEQQAKGENKEPLEPSHNTAVQRMNKANERESSIKSNNTVIIGNRPVENSGLCSAEADITLIHISNVKSETTTDNVRDFINKSLSTTERTYNSVKVDSLKTSGLYASFKAAVPSLLLDTILSTEFWPTGIKVRKFENRKTFFREQNDTQGHNFGRKRRNRPFLNQQQTHL